MSPTVIDAESKPVIQIRSEGWPESHAHIVDPPVAIVDALTLGETKTSDLTIRPISLSHYRVAYDEDLVARLAALEDPTPDVACDEDDDL